MEEVTSSEEEEAIVTQIATPRTERLRDGHGEAAVRNHRLAA
eukprot:COSAG02_NODE_21154_length_799_cov_254.700000_1_plen_41_part_10